MTPSFRAVLPVLLAACDPSPELADVESAPPEAQAQQVPVTASRFTSDFAGGCYHATLRPLGTHLESIVQTVGPVAVLVVDQDCTITGNLVLPDRFTLTGPGWATRQLSFVAGSGPITFQTGSDQEAHSTVQNLEFDGPGSGTAILLDGQHQVHLRDLIVREFTTGIDGRVSYSVDIEGCNFNNNETSLALGEEANGWRIDGGLCSQSGTCMDLHPNGDGNDTVVTGVRMESNDVAIAVGGLSTHIAFNRFEGNTADVVKAPTAVGTTLLANLMGDGTASDLSELNLGRLTRLPVIDHDLELSIVGNGGPTTQLASNYVGGANLLRTELLANQHTDDGGPSSPSYSPGYAGWEFVMDGSTQASTSMARLAYRAPASLAAPTEVFRVSSTGSVTATSYLTWSDERLKDHVTPVDGALARLGRLKGVTWDWNSGPAKDAPGMGLLAQDVAKVFPDAVHTREDGMEAVAYDQLTAPIVEAIKELADENRELRARLARLEQR